jgi:hypothetical protein
LNIIIPKTRERRGLLPKMSIKIRDNNREIMNKITTRNMVTIKEKIINKNTTIEIIKNIE